MRYRARGLFRYPRHGSVYYFRRFSASAGKRRTQRRGRNQVGWTSQGFHFGKATVNTTHGTITYDTPGPGGVDEDLPEWVMRALNATPLTRWLTRQP
jgi:hypothetical protein